MTKITQKIMDIVKGHALVKVYTDGMHFTLEEQEDMNEIIVGVTSDNPYSEFYSKYMVSTGMLDEHLPVEHVKQARVEKSDGKSELRNINKELKVDRIQTVVETEGDPATLVFLVEEQNLGQLREAINERQNGNFPMYSNTFSGFLGNFTINKVAARSSSQTRKGDLIVIPQEMDFVEYMEGQLKFYLNSYVKEIQNDKYRLSVSIQSRLKLAASSGKEFGLFDDLVYGETQTIEFEYLDGEKTPGLIHYFKDASGKEERLLVLEEDFTTRLEQEIIIPLFKKNGQTSMVKKKETFDKLATDGSMYGDMSHALSKGLSKDTQVRITPVMKGMYNLVEGLKEDTGFTAIFFGGAVKGDPTPYFKKNEIKTYILGEARDERELVEDYWMISNQLVRDLAIYEQSTLDVLERDTKELLSRAYAQDIQALGVFIGLGEQEEYLEGESVELDSENLTVEMFHANPLTFTHSDMLYKRLSDFIRPASQEVENAGRYYSKDTSYRHMVSDPYEVVRHLIEGRMAVDTTKPGADMKGIAAGHVVTNSLRNGKFKLDDRKAILGRFPLLYHLEIQVVNENGPTFYDEDSRKRYEKLFESGKHQGVIYYSLYDMTAEAQSGADYDGDTTMVIRNPELTALVQSKPKFLDYSYLEDELVEGVPWKESSSVPIENILSEEKVNFLKNTGVHYERGLFEFHKVALENRQVREYIYETIVTLDGMSNESNNIGRFTNINATVTEMLMVLNEKLAEVRMAGADNLVVLLEKEIAGYEQLNLLLASAIRWEIDKAKHGGQFYEKLEFLEFLMNPPKSDKLENALILENKYGISLLRLLQGFENSNDKVNKGLDALGIERISLERKASDSSKLNMSNSIYLGKGIDKGAKFNSRYDGYIESMKEIASSKTKEFKINEYRNGLMNEAIAYINLMKAEGIELNLETLYNAGTSIEKGEVINNPTRLLYSYRKQIKQASDPINRMRGQLLSILEESTGGRLLNGSSLGLEALMKKVKLSEEERRKGYELLAHKELVIQNHKGLGEAFTSKDPRISALLFAELYVANIRSQNAIREEKRKDRKLVNDLRKQALSYLANEWTKKHGNAQPNKKQAVAIKDWVNEYVEKNLYSDGGWGSIITLFPLGTVQFLEFIKDGRIKTESARGKNVVVYIELEGQRGIPENIKQEFQKVEGKRVTFEDGQWSGFRINKEDVSGVSKDVNPSQNEMKHLKNITKHDEIKDMKFERGAHLWNRKRSGRIVLAVVYKEGIKLFLEDSQEHA